MNPFKVLSMVKYHLSHVSASSLHYRLVESFWKRRAASSKACSYYWFKLPTSLLAAGFLVLIGALVVLVGILIGVLMVFCGFWPTVGMNEDKWPAPTFFDKRAREVRERMSYGYKRLYNGREIPVAPWQLVAGASVLYGLYFSFVTHGSTVGNSIANDVLPIVLLALGAIMILGVFFFCVSRTWKLGVARQARANVRAAWDRACPQLVVEPPKRD
jgi:hypothetical protein